MTNHQSPDPSLTAKARGRLRDARSIIVKVGSNVLIGAGDRVIDRRVFIDLVETISRFVAMGDGRRVTLVSSGAVAVGRRAIGVAPDPAESVSRKQALAAIGQPRLMTLYREEFSFYDMGVAQVLLTRADIADRGRFLNARKTLEELHQIGVVPIINENDTVAIEELRFGDNDHLASLATNLVDADLLVILSDVDGVYTANPQLDPKAERIECAAADSPFLLEVAGPSASGVGRGGMHSKVRAATIAGGNGTPTVIMGGHAPRELLTMLEGQSVGTLLLPGTLAMSSRKAWIRHASVSEGVLHLDRGAARAIEEQGKSLLPKGVVRVSGSFLAGAPVDLLTPEGRRIAIGISRFSSDEITQVCGQHSDALVERYGDARGTVLIHRDFMTLVED